MRMPTEYFAALKTAIERCDTSETRDQYRAGNFPRSDRVNDLDARYRWDLFWHVQPQLREAGHSFPDDLKDSHIDTALRRIVAPLAA